MSSPEALITTLAPWKSWGLARARTRARSLTGLLGAGTAPVFPAQAILASMSPQQPVMRPIHGAGAGHRG